MDRFLPLLLLFLAACASPSYQYFGVPARAVVIDGRTYQVFLRRDGNLAQAQVIRMGWAWGGDHRPILDAMLAAAEQASGCRVQSAGVTGDSGVMDIPLRC